MPSRFYASFCQQYLSPALTVAGFERDGLGYRRRDHRTWRVVALLVDRGSTTAARNFGVEIGLYVIPHRPWLSDQLRADVDAKIPGIEHCQFRAWVVPSADSNSERSQTPSMQAEWSVRAEDDVSRIGLELQKKIEIAALPCLDAVLATGNGPAETDWPSIAVEHVVEPFRANGRSDPIGNPLYQW